MGPERERKNEERKMRGIEAAFSGRLGSDPVEKVSSKGAPWCSFSLAVDGNEEAPVWVRVACFGDLARRCAAELKKGISRVYVEGALRPSSWQDKQTGEQRHGLEVAAWRIEPLGLIGERRPRTSKGGRGAAERTHGVLAPNAGLPCDAEVSRLPSRRPGGDRHHA
jgi:single-strand DNA-binding protein